MQSSFYYEKNKPSLRGVAGTDLVKWRGSETNTLFDDEKKITSIVAPDIPGRNAEDEWIEYNI